MAGVTDTNCGDVFGGTGYSLMITIVRKLDGSPNVHSI